MSHNPQAEINFKDLRTVRREIDAIPFSETFYPLLDMPDLEFTAELFPDFFRFNKEGYIARQVDSEETQV
ncbi:MAG: hypothetical protein U9Q06_00095 [Nanoarchaeota archaeon]|nr:hypothetical protein [Nanoarchaeota archaeon]